MRHWLLASWGMLLLVVVGLVSTLPPYWDGRREWSCVVVVVGVAAAAPSSGRLRSNGPARFCEYAARNCDLRTPRYRAARAKHRGEKRSALHRGRGRV